jgi:tRNA U34 5-carboxymethylaminomethyl modifying GTPase MnmE/TrmE
MALARLGGSIAAAIDESKRSLVQIMAAVAVQLDYPEEDTGEVVIPPETVAMARRRLAELAETYRTGRLFQEGARVALAGRTNAGKSSLFNALLREERSIVSETHGTTRDYIESRLDLEGIPVVLFDTAGLRMTEESIEGRGSGAPEISLRTRTLSYTSSTVAAESSRRTGRPSPRRGPRVVVDRSSPSGTRSTIPPPVRPRGISFP